MKPEVLTPRYFLHAGVALCALAVVAPLLLIAMVGIKLSSPGPVLYRSHRIGRDRRRMDGSGGRSATDRRRPGYGGREFMLYKLRTMNVGIGCSTAPISGRRDPRVFRFGALLRATKIDELPQLFNIVCGDMAFVGPRPEDPGIVRSHYRPADLKTLQVLPGLTSPGSLYYYTHCEVLLPDVDAMRLYVEHLLPVKLDIDRVYIRKASLGYDLRVIMRTLGVIGVRLLGRHRFPNPPELSELPSVNQ